MNTLPLVGDSRKLSALILLSLLGLLCCGPEIGGSFQPTRLLVFGGLIVGLSQGMALKNLVPPMKYFLALAAVWLMWGITSLFWTPDASKGVKEVVGLCLGFLTVTAIVNLATEESVLEKVRCGWFVAFLLTLPIAAVELFLDQHMSLSIGQDVSGDLGSSISYAATTFGNRNTYVAFIGLAFPALLWSVSVSKRWYTRAWSAFAVIAATSIVVIDATRLGIVTLVLQVLAWFWLVRGSKKQRSKLESSRRGIGIGLVLTAALVSGGLVLTANPYTQVRLALAVSGLDGSVSARTGLYQNAFLFLRNTWGFGIGAGGFSSSIENGRGSYDTWDGAITIIDPHNLWLEIASQYGAVIALLFVAWLIYCLRIQLLALKTANSVGAVEAYRAGIILLLGLPTNAMINSAYLTFTIFWAAIGTITVLSCFAWRCVHATQPQMSLFNLK